MPKYIPEDYHEGDLKKPIWGRAESGRPICAAMKNNSNGQAICHLAAGYGTSHVGYGRCKYHGGADGTGAGFGNTNAMKHGLYSKRIQEGDPIWLQLLPENIQANWEKMKTTTLEQLNNEIKLCDGRIFMIQARINALEEEDFIVTTINEETGQKLDNEGNIVPVEKATLIKENSGIQITKLYDAMTKVQQVKQKALDLKFRVESNDLDNDEADNLSTLSKALEQSAKFIRERRSLTCDKER